MYLLFSANIAARTMMSLSEIHACCIQASLDLDPLRTAYSVMTGAEEGGSGNPNQVHTVLMMKALNYHGAVVFGLPPLDLKYLMALVRLLYITRKYKNLIALQNIYPDIIHTLNEIKIIDLAELADVSGRMANLCHIELSSRFSIDIEEMKQVEQEAIEKLYMEKVVQETIDYCFAQFDILESKKSGYIQGVGFAHESLADGMIYSIFRIMFFQLSKYTSRSEFINEVYPYFSAHGNYIEVFEGLAEDASGVELTHARRELKKLSQLDSCALKAAWQGANDFSNRNVLVWDGIMRRIKSSHKKISAY